MYYLVAIGFMVIFVTARFVLYRIQRRRIGKIVIALEHYNLRQHKTQDYIVLIVGFLFIIFYYQQRFYVQMNLRAILLLCISGFFMSYGVFCILNQFCTVGIYENGIVTVQGIRPFHSISSFDMETNNARQYSLLLFYFKSKYIKPEKLMIKNDVKYSAGRYLKKVLKK